MGFYEEISKYYDYIFPVKDAQVNFIKETAGKPSKKILDIACGSGGYSTKLAEDGYDMTAVDLDEQMIEETKKKARLNHLNITALQANMLTLDKQLNKQFNTIFCIGNSVAHLNSVYDIERFFDSTYTLLQDDGSMIVQIINYDRVLDQSVKALPTIQNEDINLTFERKYDYDRENDKILFITRLQLQNKNFNNTIPLLPIRSDQFKSLIKDAGFKNVETYGDFNKTSFNEQESYHLVVRATK